MPLPSNSFVFRIRLVAAGVAVLACGCLTEQSFTVDQEDVIYVNEAQSQAPRSTRQWLQIVHERLEPLLPYEDRLLGPLLTEDLTRTDGKPVNVFAHFLKLPSMLHTVLGNFTGLSHTAQVTGSTNCVNEPAPPWEDFEDIWVPVKDGLELSARVGWAKRDGKIIDADCIVLLPGLLGDNMRLRARDIGQSLKANGYHILSLEYRGHGRTQNRFPSMAYNYGVLETGDMLAVAEWLESHPHVKETGIVAFSWSANLALLTAWENGRSDDDPSISERLKAHLRPRDGRIHFKAGIFCMSPVLDFEHLLDKLDKTWYGIENPVLTAVQGTVSWRAKLKGYDGVNGHLRTLIEREFADSELNMPDMTLDGLNYLRLLPYKDKPSGRKLEQAKVPVLILHGSDDPLAYAQEVANFFGETHNPLVAGIILKGGGHDGFPAYAKDYFFSLLLNFFDPEIGARNARPRTMVADAPVDSGKAALMSDTSASGSH